MDNQEALEWLMQNVSVWPVRLTNMRKPDGWRWIRLTCGICLAPEMIKGKNSIYSQITQGEWIKYMKAMRTSNYPYANGKPPPVEPMTEWDYILKLTEPELNSVTIISDNAEFNDGDCAIKFKIFGDDKFCHGVTYYGDTKLECLQNAYEEYKS